MCRERTDGPDAHHGWGAVPVRDGSAVVAFGPRLSSTVARVMAARAMRLDHEGTAPVRKRSSNTATPMRTLASGLRLFMAGRLADTGPARYANWLRRMPSGPHHQEGVQLPADYEDHHSLGEQVGCGLEQGGGAGEGDPGAGAEQGGGGAAGSPSSQPDTGRRWRTRR